MVIHFCAPQSYNQSATTSVNFCVLRLNKTFCKRFTRKWYRNDQLFFHFHLKMLCLKRKQKSIKNVTKIESIFSLFFTLVVHFLCTDRTLQSRIFANNLQNFSNSKFNLCCLRINNFQNSQ